MVECFRCDVTYPYPVLVLGHRTVQHRVEDGTSRDQHVAVGGYVDARAVWCAYDELDVAFDLIVEHVSVAGEHSSTVLPVPWCHLKWHGYNITVQLVAIYDTFKTD